MAPFTPLSFETSNLDLSFAKCSIPEDESQPLLLTNDLPVNRLLLDGDLA